MINFDNRFITEIKYKNKGMFATMPILMTPVVCELEGPTVIGPMISKMPKLASTFTLSN